MVKLIAMGLAALSPLCAWYYAEDDNYDRANHHLLLGILIILTFEAFYT